MVLIIKTRIPQAKVITSVIRMDKLAIYKSLATDFETAQAFASACEGITLHTEDHKEGVRAFAEKRQPVFQGR